MHNDSTEQERPWLPAKLTLTPVLLTAWRF
uniref:Uncharacterized protein n=1 Tax=Anguilla anguilla TaxID=7936 RepID=A0A0E9SD46_ANGAN